jgi:hypothetical protein
MVASRFDYWTGSTWANEGNYIRLTITDELYLPLSLSVTIGNTTGDTLNARESVYTRYQKVRVTEGNTGRIIFYGKIERIKPNYDGMYGQSIELVCRDNLNELLKQEMNEDGVYTGTSFPTSGIITDIINGGSGDEFTAHAWTEGAVPNIGTSDNTKIIVSSSNLQADEGTRKFSDLSKTPLRAIEELAINDKQDTNTHLKGHDFFLDFKFDGLLSNAASEGIPDFNYHSRGTVPTTPGTYGLTLEYKGDDTADKVRAVFPDYAFPREASEIVTRVRMEYVTDINDGKTPKTKNFIMINHGAVSGGGTFAVGNTVTWNSGSKTAYVKKVLENNRGVVIGPDHPTTEVLSTTWLDPISGYSDFTNGSSTATVNATGANPPGSIRETISQDIEVVVKQYEITTDIAAGEHASEILQHGGDIVIRGNVSILQWPYHRVSGTSAGVHASELDDSGAQFIRNGIRVGDEITNVTDSITGLITAVTATKITVGAGGMSWAADDVYEVYVMNRTGHSVYVKSMPPTDIADQVATITQIAYTEGPGMQQSVIELLLLANDRGSGVAKNSARNIVSKVVTGNANGPGRVGVREISGLKWEYSGSFTTPTANQVNWSGGILKLSDERTFDIAAGNTGTISASAPGNGKEFLYFNIDSPTIFTSTPNAAATVAINTIYIAQFSRPTSGTVPEFIAYGTMGTALKIDGTAITHFNTSIEGWTQEVGFSSTNANTVSWAGGALTSGNGTVYTIAAGSVAGMSTRWYVYLDINTSTTVLQTSSTAGNAVGSGKILVATAKNETGEATFFVFSGDAKLKVNGPDIVANSIDTNQINTGAITSDEIYAGAITSDKIRANNITAGLLDSTLILTTAIVISAAEAASGGRWELTSAGIIGYNSSNASQVRLISANTASGGKIIMGADGSETVALDVDGIQLIGAGNTSIDFRSTLNGSLLGSIGLNASSNIEIASLGADIKITTVSSGTLTLTGVAGMDLIASADINISPTGGGKVVVATPITLFDGTTSNLSIRRSSDATTGLYFYTSGLYKGLVCKGNGRDLWWAASDGTNDWMVIDSHIDMNNYTITDCYEVRAGDGSAGDPSHTFDDHLTSGMYYDAGVAISAGGSIKMKLTTTEVTVSDDLNPNSTGSYRNLGNNSLRWAKLWSGSASDTTSDAELKENLTPISNGLDFISRLSPITFNRINDSEVQFGFTAQAVKQAVLDSGYTENLGVYSEKTDEVTGDTHWGIAYSTLVAPLVAAIKELKERIEVLEGN